MDRLASIMQPAALPSFSRQRRHDSGGALGWQSPARDQANDKQDPTGPAFAKVLARAIAR